MKLSGTLAVSIVFMFFISSCSMKEKADLLLLNGKIYTVDSSFAIKEAMVISDGLIVALGSTEEINKAWKSDSTIDLGGKAVYPGFNDGHCHFVGYALGLVESIDLTGTRSFDEILQILQDKQQGRPGTWIVGRGWDQNDWEINVFPDNRKLNELFPSNPVVLSRIDGHAVLVNSVALQMAGIKADTKIHGGEIMVKDGVPTGILLDNAADLFKAMIPGIGEEAQKDALELAQNNCFAVGLTSVSDAGLDYKTIIFIDSLQINGTLKIRINAMLNPTGENFREFVSKGPFQKDKLNVTSIKLYADGALGSRGALLLEPYSDDPGNYGILLSQPDSLRKIITEAYAKNFQVNTHCIGDSANRMILHLYAEVLKGKNDRRWRIEHAQVINPKDFQLFGMYNVIPSVQATHCTSDMYWAGERLGPERVKGAYAYKQLLEQNGWLINGTDFPVEDIDPLYTFYAAVARKDLKGFPDGGFQPENALSREEALRSITIWPGKGSFEESRKGSLEPGKFADFVILDKDIMTIDIREVPDIKVYATYIDGEKVYQVK